MKVSVVMAVPSEESSVTSSPNLSAGLSSVYLCQVDHGEALYENISSMTVNPTKVYAKSKSWPAQELDLRELAMVRGCVDTLFWENFPPI